MSNEVILALLASDRVIVPFEEFREMRLVSTLIASSQGKLKSFNFLDQTSDGYGPDALVEANLSDSEIRHALARSTSHLEFIPDTITIIWKNERSEGRLKGYMTSMHLGNTSDRTRVILEYKDSPYPFAFVLR